MIIDEFMAQYERTYDFFLRAAQLCQERCETQLAQKGIRAIVTSRAKKPDRLYQKLKQRASETNYSCYDDIYEDIVDLAGVRIALYFPGDRDEVDKLIKAEFIVKKTKRFPDPGEKALTDEKRFSGYAASHYHVNLKGEHLTEERFSRACIEIQVASVLMHGWAEVEHDLLYKPLSGKLSKDERAILDEINGIVLIGESALERLQEAQEWRIGKKGSHFEDQYDLATYLSNQLRSKPPVSTMIMGRADVLFHFLKKAELDRPEELTNFISDLDTTDNQRTISDQLLDRIIPTNSELYYKKLEEALFEINTQQLNSSFDERPVELFLTLWIALENLMDIALVHHIDTTSSAVFTSELFGGNLEAFREYERLRRLRNEIVHRGKIPENDVLLIETDSIKALLNLLYNSFSEEVRRKATASEVIRKFLTTENQ